MRGVAGAVGETRYPDKVRESEAGSPGRGLEEEIGLHDVPRGRRDLQVQAKGELLSWERKRKRIYRVGGRRGGGDQKGDGSARAGQIRRILLTNWSSRAG